MSQFNKIVGMTSVSSSTNPFPNHSVFIGVDDDDDDSFASAAQSSIIHLTGRPSSRISQLEDRSTKTVDEEIEDDTSQRTYLAIAWQSGRLGAAVYHVATAELCIMPEYAEPSTSDFLTTKMLLQQVGPTNVVTMSKLDDRFRKFLYGCVAKTPDDESSSLMATTDENPTTDWQPMHFQLEAMQNVDFGYSVAKQQVYSLNTPTMPALATEEERTVYFSSILPADSVQSIRAAGALLKLLNRKRVGLDISDSSAEVPISAIRTFFLENVMLLDRSTMLGLKIFSPRSHPSVYKAAGRFSAKEGFSLCQVYQSFCSSALGRRLINSWLMRPLQDLKEIEKRQQAVEYFSDPKNAMIVKELRNAVRYIRDTRRTIFRMKAAQVTSAEWKSFAKSLRASCDLIELCRRLSNRLRVIQEAVLTLAAAPPRLQPHSISSTMTSPLHSDNASTSGTSEPSAMAYSPVDLLEGACALIFRVVDFGDEKGTGPGKNVVKANVDCDLDKKRQLYNALPGILESMQEHESARFGFEIACAYVPQLGYFVTLPDDPLQQNKRRVIEQDNEACFVQEGLLHYKTDVTRQLDENYGDIYSDIRDREVQIMASLQSRIIHIADALVLVADVAAKIDCLMAFAACAVEFRYVRPKITDQVRIQIKKGRHPLQELCCNPFIANDVVTDSSSSSSSSSGGKVLIITGANASGKSVYLKQIGLIIYMAHLGSFVPAESATIGLTDRIFTRIKSISSLSTGLSSFVNDVNDVSVALRCATNKSIVLIDEFGKGTNNIDGAALLSACLNKWLRSGLENCPNVLVATHLYQTMFDSMLTQSPLLCLLTLQTTTQTNGQLVHLHRVVIGKAESSYAISAARSGGLSERLLDRAKVVHDAIAALKPIPQISEIAESDVIVEKIAGIVLSLKDGCNDLEQSKSNVESIVQLLLNVDQVTNHDAF